MKSGMFTLPIKSKHSIAPLLVLFCSVLLALTEPLSSEWFAYNRLDISHLQFWRLITGHFLHTNLIHLLLNLAGLGLLWALHGHYYQNKQYITVMLLLCLGTSAGIYVFSADLQWYVGLSGVLHGLFVLGAYFDIRHHLTSGWLLLLSVWIKVLYEQFYGASQDIAQLIDANVAIDAHLFGTLSGTVLILYFFTLHKKRLRNEPK